jgi:hypothetical protein
MAIRTGGFRAALQAAMHNPSFQQKTVDFPTYNDMFPVSFEW